MIGSSGATFMAFIGDVAWKSLRGGVLGFQRRSHSKSREEVDAALQGRLNAWLNGPGENFRQGRSGRTNYVTAYTTDGRSTGRRGGSSEANWSEGNSGSVQRPFPLNPTFRSESILGPDVRAEIVRRVNTLKHSIRRVSGDLNVSIPRICAVVRLAAIEDRWISEGRPTADVYANTILSMLPVTKLTGESGMGTATTTVAAGVGVTSAVTTRHEEVNDVPIHAYTRQPVFHPVPESRVFTRADAARAFNPRLLPLDARLPLPELLDDSLEESRSARNTQRIRYDDQVTQARRVAITAARRTRSASVVQVRASKSTFLFVNMTVDGKLNPATSSFALSAQKVINYPDWIFKPGRSRYGVPLNDRKRGVIKIFPTPDTLLSR